mmetsp:Transcript_25491/g.80425  ORF Transcript_25491/g.80425 Transcript_25491/m.80425 type:complete len:205 (+) Transcript_25491:1238-1852(+)
MDAAGCGFGWTPSGRGCASTGRASAGLSWGGSKTCKEAVGFCWFAKAPGQASAAAGLPVTFGPTGTVSCIRKAAASALGCAMNGPNGANPGADGSVATAPVGAITAFAGPGHAVATGLCGAGARLTWAGAGLGWNSSGWGRACVGLSCTSANLAWGFPKPCHETVGPSRLEEEPGQTPVAEGPLRPAVGNHAGSALCAPPSNAP